MPTPIIPIITETSTNTLVNITNGTKIYQQQEITITHISYTINKTNITNTDWITNTINSIPQLDKIETILDKVWYQDPTVWGAIATVISAIAMIVTAYIMYQGNKISAKSSADSIHEMKEQHTSKQYREDKKALRDFIEQYITPEVKKQRLNIRSMNNPIVEQDIEFFNIRTYSSLMDLKIIAIESFYEDRLIRILNIINYYSPIAIMAKEYSYKAKFLFDILLHGMSITIYKALINERSCEI